ncbi:MAG TPA: START domain-containing protein [Chitinophagales bacterium]|nr:START domain-containing protein [Chitinophagales bacterium]
MSALSAAQPDGWLLEKDKNGIRVYTKKNSKSNLKDSQSIMVINTTAGKAFELFTDFERHNKWMDRIRTSRLLKKVSDTEFYVYYEVTAPWPASDRDVVVHYKMTELDSGGFKMEAIGKPDYVPRKEGMVRVPESHSTWEFIPKGGKLEVIFTSHSDPGGSIPDWLANMTAADNPYNTLSNLRKLLGGE